jgi:hypothetical protein
MSVKGNISSNQSELDEKAENMLEADRGKVNVKPAKQRSAHLVIDVATSNAISPAETDVKDTASQPLIQTRARIKRVRSGPPKAPVASGRPRSLSETAQKDAIHKDIRADSDDIFTVQIHNHEDTWQLKKLLDTLPKNTEAEVQPNTQDRSRKTMARGTSNDLVVVSLEESKKGKRSQTIPRTDVAPRPSQFLPISSRSASRSPQRTGADASPVRLASRSPQRTGNDVEAVRSDFTAQKQGKPMTLPALHWELPSPGCRT